MRSITRPLIAIVAALLVGALLAPAGARVSQQAPAGPGGGTGQFWRLAGNKATTPGTHFLGTSDDAALELRVDGERGLLLEPRSTPNVVGGHEANSTSVVVSPEPDAVVGATIGGGGLPGQPNRVTDNYGTVGGGFGNQAGNDIGRTGKTDDRIAATVGGGEGNRATGGVATIGGGFFNTAGDLFATVAGGGGNAATDNSATVGGGADNTASDFGATVGGGENNDASGRHAAIGAGVSNEASGRAATIGGGSGNAATAGLATVGGGFDNTASDDGATIGGGISNIASSDGATIGGGEGNTASSGYATVAGGVSGIADGVRATIGGGFGNTASGQDAMVPGGDQNSAAGDQSFAAGFFAKANHDGAFVWADSSGLDMASSAPNQFVARAEGGFFLQDDSSLDDQEGFLNTSTGAHLTRGGVWTNASDRALKAGFAAVDPQDVLAGVAELPVMRWHYRAEGPAVSHLGPTAQDFRAAFGLGADESTIGTVDADGVALAAIQGLNEVVEKKDARIADLEGRIERLEAAPAGDASPAAPAGFSPWALAPLVLLAGLALGALARRPKGLGI